MPYFLAWADPSAKRTPAQKARDAANAFKQRFGFAPDVVMVPLGADIGAVDGLNIVEGPNVPANMYWAGPVAREHTP